MRCGIQASGRERARPLRAPCACDHSALCMQSCHVDAATARALCMRPATTRSRTLAALPIFSATARCTSRSAARTLHRLAWDDRSGSGMCASGQVTAAARCTIAHPLQPRPASSAGPAPAAAPPQRALPALSQPPARAGACASKHDRKEAQQQSESARRRCRCGRHGSGVSMASMSRKYVKTSDTCGPMQCTLRGSGRPKHKARLAVSCPPSA